MSKASPRDCKAIPFFFLTTMPPSGLLFLLKGTLRFKKVMWPCRSLEKVSAVDYFPRKKRIEGPLGT